MERSGRADDQERQMRAPLYYGWVIVLTLAATETVSWGILSYGFGVLLVPIEREFGWSRAATAGAFSLAILISGVAGLPVGRWVDRHGPRWLMTGGSLLAVAGLLALARVESLPAYYAVWALLGVAMAATLYEPAFVAVAAWFVRRRGRALAVLTFLAGFASVIFVPLIGWLERWLTWRPAVDTLALLLLVLTVPAHALVLRRRPEDLGLTPDGEPPAPHRPAPLVTGWPTRLASASPQFAWLTLAMALALLGSAAITVHLVAFLLEVGYPAGLATLAAGLVGTASLPGRLALNALGDRVPRATVLAGILVSQVVAIVILIGRQDVVWVLAFVLLYGAGFGAITPLRAALVADYFGRAHYGGILAVQGLALAVARAVGPLLAGLLRDGAGSYTLAFTLVAVATGLAAVGTLLAERAHLARRRSEVLPTSSSPPDR
jgi:MFS family permease